MGMGSLGEQILGLRDPNQLPGQAGLRSHLGGQIIILPIILSLDL